MDIGILRTDCGGVHGKCRRAAASDGDGLSSHLALCHAGAMALDALVHALEQCTVVGRVERSLFVIGEQSKQLVAHRPRRCSESSGSEGQNVMKESEGNEHERHGAKPCQFGESK